MQIDEIKEQLLEKLESLKDELKDLENMDPSNDPDQNIDPALDEDYEKTEEKFKIEALKNELSQQQEMIQSALDKITNNNYGICENCGKKISQDRLEAVPYARYCVECQTELDKAKEITEYPQG